MFHLTMALIQEGPLSKWTNVVKGWQYRWFVLDSNTGILSYYTVSVKQLFPDTENFKYLSIKQVWWKFCLSMIADTIQFQYQSLILNVF